LRDKKEIDKRDNLGKELVREEIISMKNRFRNLRLILVIKKRKYL